MLQCHFYIVDDRKQEKCRQAGRIRDERGRERNVDFPMGSVYASLQRIVHVQGDYDRSMATSGQATLLPQKRICVLRDVLPVPFSLFTNGAFTLK